MNDLPQGRISHFTKGRLRLKLPDKRGDEPFFAAVEQQLAGWDSVDGVEANPLTASVLVHFSDPAVLFAENALKNNLFAVSHDDIERNGEPAASVTEWAARQVGDADQVVLRWTGGIADIRAVVFLLLAGAGVIQLLRGNIAAPAATLLWYAGGMLRMWDVMPEVKQAINEG